MTHQRREKKREVIQINREDDEPKNNKDQILGVEIIL
jgi:hypothetical protein